MNQAKRWAPNAHTKRRKKLRLEINGGHRSLVCVGNTIDRALNQGRISVAEHAHKAAMITANLEKKTDGNWKIEQAPPPYVLPGAGKTSGEA